MVDEDRHRRLRPSWLRTVLTQAALCLAFYAAFNIAGRSGGEREAMDVYFLSVRGGAWPVREQAQLLRQMEKAVKVHKAKFVLNIREFGEDDPLMQNATLRFPLLKIPWYTTTAHGQITRNFLKSVKMPHNQVLDIIGLDTGPFQASLSEGKPSEAGREQLDWLQKTLASRDSNWRIIVGFDQLVACGDQNTNGSLKFYEPLYKIFLEHGVNAYLSRQGCAGYHYHDGRLAYIGHPATLDEKHNSHSINGKPGIPDGRDIWFLLHRVSPLEMESYYIGSSGKIIFKTTIHQW